MQKNIKWNFILEKAPWWGGFYERLIGIVKSSLRESFTKVIINLLRNLYCYNRNRKCYEFTPFNLPERRRISRKFNTKPSNIWTRYC